MSPILVHQSLHGYSDGHRLISSSLRLDTADAHVMLVMSDLSGPGVKPSPNGYLTGYPLNKSGKYVLARTWAAPEMSRPGCVWTHSLIIENADLARIKSGQTLLEAFSRPNHTGTLSLSYDFPIPVLAHLKPNGIIRTEQVELLLHSLYSFPTQSVVIEAGDSSEDERAATAIWMQQWPRLRRSFGFCTLSGMDRSGKGVALDLQFVPEKERQLRAKFPDALVADQGQRSDALQPLLNDLADPASSTLREFLRRVGGDVDGGRRAMLPLCELHESLLERHPPDLVSAVTALGALDVEGKKKARAVRSLVLRQAMRFDGQFDDVVFEFLLEALTQSRDPEELSEFGDKITTELWRRSPYRFHSELVSAGPISDAAAHSLSKMESEQIILGLQSNGDIANDIVKRRPDILMHEAFWRIPDVDDTLAEYASDRDVGSVARALLVAGRISPAMHIISRTTPADLVRALESFGVDRKAMLEWLKALCLDRIKTAAVLATGQIMRLETIVTVARLIRPDDIPNDHGEDPWVIALRSASGSLDRSEEDFLAAFLLARALGWESKSQAELLRYSYVRVYRAFEERRFSYDVESLASSRLDWGTWFAWDNCSRLRETVTRRFVEHDLDPECFGRLADDTSIAVSLIDEAARTRRGRDYLERVLVALENAKEKRMRAMAEHIASKLK